MMHMAFYLSENLSNFLFKGWNTTTAGGIVWTCFVIGGIVLVLEMMKVLQGYLHKKSKIIPGSSQSQGSLTEDPLLPSLVVPPAIAHLRNRKIKYHVLQSLLHILQLVIGYLVMLAVMSYNGWIGISVAIASAIGFYIFGAMRFVMAVPPPTKSSRGSQEDREGSSQGSEHLSSEPTPLYT